MSRFKERDYGQNLDDVHDKGSSGATKAALLELVALDFWQQQLQQSHSYSATTSSIIDIQRTSTAGATLEITIARRGLPLLPTNLQ